MTTLKQVSLAALLALGLGATATAQQAAPGQQPGDQVDQLDRMVDLSDDQKQELRELIKDSEGKITEMRTEAQQLQQALSDQIGPDYDEGEIRDNAEELERADRRCDRRKRSPAGPHPGHAHRRRAACHSGKARSAAA